MTLEVSGMFATHRTVHSLDGRWNVVVPATGLTHEVTVPGSWTTQVARAGDSHDEARYRRSFLVELPGDSTRRFVLRFGAVNHQARVRVNGRAVGEHCDAWLPFEIDVTEALVEGENLLEVDVLYPPRFGTTEEPGFLERPLGKQSWYGTNAGIWQSVTLEERDSAYVGELTVRADAATGCISVAGNVTSAEGVSVGLEVSSASGSSVTVPLRVAGNSFEGEAQIESPALWDLDTPHLYDVTVHVDRDGQTVDSVTRTTGFRTFEANEGRFWLNGREIYLRGVLDQDYHPGSELAPADFDEWEQLLRATKNLGFNMLRVHIKRPHPRYYEMADRIGVLVWTELPSWMTWTPESSAEGMVLLNRLIAEDSHHPSIVIWTVINESWGIDLEDPTQRTWLRSAFAEAKSALGSALLVDNSACEPNYHLHTDIDDFHVYRGIPEARAEWDEVVADFAARPAWTFSPHGDADRSGLEPLVLSEFGNWGLPYALDQFDDGNEPWWFALGAAWAFGAAEGTHLLPRFRELGLDRVFGSWEALVAQLQHAQLVANRYQTTSIRLHDEIRGYVLTQLSDAQWEANGLFDMYRAPKRGTAEFALANGEHAVALRPVDYSVFAGGSLRAVVTTLPGPAGLAPGTIVRVTLDGVPVEAREVPTHRSTWEPQLEMPMTPGSHVVAAELITDGVVVARDTADILVASESGGGDIAARATDPAVQEWLDRMGVQHDPDSVLLVTRCFDTAARAHAVAGGRVLLLAEDESALGGAFGYLPSARLGPRTGDGDWVPRTEWLDRTGVFAGVPGDPVLGIAFEELLGELVVTGIPGPLRPAQVHSGIFSGWLRGVATSTATVRWSRGAVTLTTLRVREATVPIAKAVGLGLLHAAASAVVSRI